MRKLFNKFIGYTDRTIEQQETAILDKINSPDGIPEMTDHTYSNVFVKMIKIWTGLMEVLHAYVDNAAEESFPAVAQEFKSLVKYANLIDYRIKGRLSASVDLTFFISSATTAAINIPAGTRVKSKNGIVFVTVANCTIAIGQTEVTVGAKNETVVTGVNIGTGNGQKGQKFPILKTVVDNSITFITGVINWIPLESLMYAQSNQFAFVAGLNEEGVMTITTGDGVNGYIPQSGIDLIATYKICDGANANLPSNTITILDSSVTVPSGVILQVTNRNPSIGGADQEGIDQLRKNLFAFNHTLNRAVKLQDYEKIAEMAPGVAKAKARYLNKKVVDIFIAPTGSTTGIASTVLINTTDTFMQSRRLVGKQISVQSAGVIKLKLHAKLYLSDGYLPASKQLEGKQVLSNFLSIPNQEIGGSVGLGDLYQLLENIQGVRVSEIELLTPVPYARPLGHEEQLLWDREITPESNQTVRWRIFTNDPFTFKLIRNTSYVGTFNYEDEVVLPEIRFTVYQPGYGELESWEFFTYPYNGSIQLSDGNQIIEPSIPVAEMSDIIITTVGGVA